MELMQVFVGRALAQGTPSSPFTLDSFTNLLNPFAPGTNEQAGVRLNTLVGTIIGVILTVAAIVAFVYLIVAGFQYITAGGDAAKAETARKGIVNALIGIVVILVAYILLRYVAGLVGGDAQGL